MDQTRERRLRELSSAHVGAVGDYVRRLLAPLDSAALDDVIEETLLVVWRRLDEVPVGSERAWIIGVARHILQNTKRSWFRRHAAESRVQAPLLLASAEDQMVATLSLREALAQLTDEDRDVLLMKVWDGLSNEEIAVTISLSVGAVAVKLSRAQAKLRELLAEVEVR